MAGNNEGTWVTAQLDPQVLIQPIEPALATTETVVEILITTLNVLQSILEVVKTFAAGLIDPVRALVEQIIALVRAYLSDLRSIGLYLYVGDVNAMKPNYSALVGGYAAFENRFVRALTDSYDNTRPKASANTQVIGIFFYLSADLRLVFDIIRLAKALQRLFNFPTGDFQTSVTPVQLAVSYGNPDLGLASFSRLERRITVDGDAGAVALRWKMPAGPQDTDKRMPPPGGFIIEVSAIPTGMGLLADTPDPNSTSEIPGRTRLDVIDPDTGEPVTVYGGTDTVVALTNSNRNSPQIYLTADQDFPQIPVNALADLQDRTNRRYLGRSFFLSNSVLKALPPGQGFAVILKRSEFPYLGEFIFDPPTSNDQLYGRLVVRNPYQPSIYYVSVRAVDRDRARAISRTVDSGKGTVASPATYALPLYKTVEANDILTGATTRPSFALGKVSNHGEFSLLSDAVVANFPTDTRLVEVLQTAVLIALLARCDFPVTESAQDGAAQAETSLESIMQRYIRELDISRSFYSKRANDSIGFCQALLQKTSSIVGDMLNSELVSENGFLVITLGKPLLSFTWSMADRRLPSVSVLESVRATALGEVEYIDATGIRISDRAFKRPPQFWDFAPETEFGAAITAFSVATIGINLGPNSTVLTDFSPVVRFRPGTSPTNPVDGLFCRNALVELYPKALSVLTLSGSKEKRSNNKALAKSKNWLSLRFIPNGIPPLDRLLDNIDAFAQAILDGLEDVSAALIEYITFVQIRIRNIQAILDQIQAIIDYIRNLSLPTASVLVLSEGGNSGLIAGLSSSENKPADTSQSYGFGFAAVGVGLPVFLMDLLAQLFAAPTDEGV